MEIIKSRKLKYEYVKYDDNGQPCESYTAVKDVDFDVKAGQFISILGHNGSGKSTLAKHINALLLPTEEVYGLTEQIRKLWMSFGKSVRKQEWFSKIRIIRLSVR